jgi:hypothetical protein
MRKANVRNEECYELGQPDDLPVVALTIDAGNAGYNLKSPSVPQGISFNVTQARDLAILLAKKLGAVDIDIDALTTPKLVKAPSQPGASQSYASDGRAIPADGNLPPKDGTPAPLPANSSAYNDKRLNPYAPAAHGGPMDKDVHEQARADAGMPPSANVDPNANQATLGASQQTQADGAQPNAAASTELDAYNTPQVDTSKPTEANP